MNVTKAVISDLIPLYEAGEASQDSCALIEQFLAEHPDFANTLQNDRKEMTAMLSSNSVGVPALSRDLEMSTLLKTKKLIEKRSYLLAGAVAITAVAIAMTVEALLNDRLVLGHHLGTESYMVSLFWFLASIYWAVFIRARKELNSLGF